MSSVEKALTLEEKGNWRDPIDSCAGVWQWCPAQLFELRLPPQILWPTDPASSKPRRETMRIRDENAHL